MAHSGRKRHDVISGQHNTACEKTVNYMAWKFTTIQIVIMQSEKKQILMQKTYQFKNIKCMGNMTQQNSKYFPSLTEAYIFNHSEFV